jgi:hypothetical protein
VVDQLAPLAALGAAISTLRPAFSSSASAQAPAPLGGVVDQDQARDRLVLIELAEEGGQDFGVRSSDLSTRGK